jgi:hypothetical protein
VSDNSISDKSANSFARKLNPEVSYVLNEEIAMWKECRRRCEENPWQLFSDAELLRLGMLFINARDPDVVMDAMQVSMGKEVNKRNLENPIHQVMKRKRMLGK